mmetsp:Transcript_51272/g.111650  ORF Transcript_51272/g.111650 Transcript_51272/m.111650 type:complete len:211 (-) Transcript_51272:594-1226(-)
MGLPCSWHSQDHARTCNHHPRKSGRNQTPCRFGRTRSQAAALQFAAKRQSRCSSMGPADQTAAVPAPDPSGRVFGCPVAAAKSPSGSPRLQGKCWSLPGRPWQYCTRLPRTVDHFPALENWPHLLMQKQCAYPRTTGCHFEVQTSQPRSGSRPFGSAPESRHALCRWRPCTLRFHQLQNERPCRRRTCDRSTGACQMWQRLGPRKPQQHG